MTGDDLLSVTPFGVWKSPLLLLNSVNTYQWRSRFRVETTVDTDHLIGLNRAAIEDRKRNQGMDSACFVTENKFLAP